MTKALVALGLALATAAGLPGPARADGMFTVDPDAGNNNFTAVFDSQVGERITAMSSALECRLTVDEAQLEGRATCAVPLTSVRVDGNDTKTEHFRQWATNKTVEPEKCTFDLDVPSVKLPPPVDPKRAVSFSTEGTFKICGRPRDDHGTEHITGTVTYLPAGSYGDARTLRIRARVEHFDRERYGVSPKATPGWLARVQQLADVVATEGTIDVSMFATSPDGAAKP